MIRNKLELLKAENNRSLEKLDLPVRKFVKNNVNYNRAKGLPITSFNIFVYVFFCFGCLASTYFFPRFLLKTRYKKYGIYIVSLVLALLAIVLFTYILII